MEPNSGGTGSASDDQAIRFHSFGDSLLVIRLASCRIDSTVIERATSAATLYTGRASATGMSAIIVALALPVLIRLLRSIPSATACSLFD